MKLLFGIFAIILLILTVQSSLSQGDIVTNGISQENGSIEILFCPQEPCESKFLETLESAKISIHCALFDVGLISIQEVLLKKSEMIDVRIVTDDGYLKKFNHPFVRVDKWGLMHNKFCIIDDTIVTTGSMNPTNNGAHKNNNNFIVIESKTLVENYNDEFDEMWDGIFKKGERVKNPKLILNGIFIENYFCPEDDCAKRIKQELMSANESIYFMTFSFTNSEIANILLLKHQQNISIQGVMEARQVSKHSVFDVLKYQGIDVVKDINKQNMHHKVFVIDGKTVITGSMNPTQGGNTRNDENVLIIHDKKIAKKYLEEFENLQKVIG